MTTTSAPQFIDADFRAELEIYLHAKLPDKINEKYLDFLPTVEERIEKICQGWKSQLQEKAANGFFHTKLSNRSFITTIEECNLILKQFIKILSLEVINATYQIDCYNNELLDTLPKGQIVNFECHWSPKNLHLYPKEEVVPTKRYVQELDHNAKKHFELAKNGIDTDCILKSKEKEEIKAHLLYLKGRSEYFKACFGGAFQEGDSKIIKLDFLTQTIQNLREFIYLGKISSNLSLKSLFELGRAGNHLMISDLFDYVLDLLDMKLSERLTYDEIIQVITFAADFDKTELCLSCLKVAEQLEEQKDRAAHFEKVDWTKLPPSSLGKFLLLARDHKLQATEAKILAALKTMETPSLTKELIRPRFESI